MSLISAWHYARRTGRTLVIDWRSSVYLDDPRRNAFPAYFEPVTAIADVRVVSDETVGKRDYPTPVHGSFGHRALHGLRRWLSARDLAPSSAQVVAAYHRSHAEEQALLERGEDLAAPTIVLRCSLSEGLPGRAACQAVLGALQPRSDIRAEIDRFARAHFTDRPVIGVHVRYGSRAIADSHTAYWRDDEQAVATICAGIRSAAGALPGPSRIFLCTDDGRILDALRVRLPELIAREKYFQPAGPAELHAWRNPPEIRAAIGRDALIEMFLLARVDALVCYPPHSFFSFYARTCAAGPRIQIREHFRPQTI